jgi:hypothetical protein
MSIHTGEIGRFLGPCGGIYDAGPIAHLSCGDVVCAALPRRSFWEF